MNKSVLFNHTAFHGLQYHALMQSQTLSLSVVAAILFSMASSAAAQTTDAFVRKHCIECHSGKSIEGGLDLSLLETDLTQPALFAAWERIHDRVAAGEMPPRDANQPSQAERLAYIDRLAGALHQSHSAVKGTVLRRLNRREYQNTLNDMFGTNVDIVSRLPEDSRFHEFDNIGQALGISQVQLQRYLECIDAVFKQAIVATIEPPPSKMVRASYADTQGAEQWLGKIWHKCDDGAVVLFKDYGYPTGMLREATVEREGWYKIRVIGYAYQSDRPITFSLGAVTFARGVEQPTYGYFEMPPGEPTTIEVSAWIPSRYMIEVTPQGISDTNNELKQKGADAYPGPGLAIQTIEVEGPTTQEWPSRGHRLLFDGLDRTEVMPRNPADRTRPRYVPKFDIHAADEEQAIMPILTRVAVQAFRRSVSADQLAAYWKLFRAERTAGASIEESLKTAVSAIFCSPDFLYLREPPGVLDDYALASRLSYFLTRSAPDRALLDAAASGSLVKEPAALKQHALRLLAVPEANRFVVDFTDAWLNLREINFTNPDAQLYPEFDAFLQWSSLEESRSYWRKLIDDNLSVEHVVASDFSMLNNRLAQHYGIDDVEGPNLRAVKLPAGSVRGGFLSQASVLKVSANGTSTSPVVRGVWVMERILGKQAPPPPPGVPGIEPDIRGANTLRELLDKHRSSDNCRGCHRQIDPPGFALESFDPIGGFRDRFRTTGNSGDRPTVLVRGQKVRYRLGAPVDASGELSDLGGAGEPSTDGEKFAGFNEFRELLKSRRRQLAESLTVKLLTFGTGREMGFSDRREIKRIVDQAEQRGFGVKDLLMLAIDSPIFRNK